MFPLRFSFITHRTLSLPLHAHSLLSHSSLHFFTLFSLSTLSLHLLTLLHFFPTFSHHFSHSTLSGHFFFPFLLHFLTLFCLSTFSLYFLYFFSYFLSFLPTFSFHFLTLLSLLTVQCLPQSLTFSFLVHIDIKNLNQTIFTKHIYVSKTLKKQYTHARTHTHTLCQTSPTSEL